MDARERWQALQARLKDARAAFDAGDRDTALAAVNAALELDAEFLAAHALRDRILAMDTPHLAPSTSHPAADTPHLASDTSHLAPDTSHRAPSTSHLTSQTDAPAGYANFEQRARRRRVDRKIDAARAAIEQQRLKAAAAALDEVIDLDPNLPELAELTATFDDLRRAAATPRRGAWAVAAAVFAAALLGGTWLQDSTPILSRQIVAAAPLPSLAPTAALGGASTIETAGTTGVRDTASASVVAPQPASRAAVDLHVAAPTIPQAAVRPLAGVTVDPPPPARLADALSDTADPAAIVPASTTVSPRPERRDDDELIKQTLQRYRSAYEGLDAQSAHAVWPAVNEVALARAFDGLESQSLTFDACDVRQYGESATATCHGSARYVPKIGSREPRVEPRIWNFTLRKAGTDWKIDSARAER
jgi:tetratricopeptide (TPR) repeat protein